MTYVSQVKTADFVGSTDPIQTAVDALLSNKNNMSPEQLQAAIAEIIANNPQAANLNKAIYEAQEAAKKAQLNNSDIIGIAAIEKVDGLSLAIDKNKLEKDNLNIVSDQIETLGDLISIIPETSVPFVGTGELSKEKAEAIKKAVDVLTSENSGYNSLVNSNVYKQKSNPLFTALGEEIRYQIEKARIEEHRAKSDEKRPDAILSDEDKEKRAERRSRKTETVDDILESGSLLEGLFVNSSKTNNISR